MPPAYIKAVVTFASADGLPADEYTNQFHYSCATGVDSAGMTGALEAFYNLLYGAQTVPLAYYLSQYISRTVKPTVKYTDVTAHLNGAPAGGPFASDTFTSLGASASTGGLPNQDVATLSYYDALDVSGTTKGDHRGRIFLGPLDKYCIHEDVGGPHLLEAMCQDMVLAMNGLWTALPTLSPAKELTVWSRKDAVMRTAAGCFVNNDFTTLRKRAYAANARYGNAF